MTKHSTLILLLLASIAVFVASGWRVQEFGECRLGMPSFDKAIQVSKTIKDSCGKVGDRTRQSYVKFLWTYDLVAPLVYGASLYVAISFWIALAWPGAPAAAGLRWIAVAAAAADYFENVLQTLLLAGWTESATVAAVSGLATLIKWALYFCAIGVAVIAGAGALIRRLHGTVGAAHR